MKIEPEGTSLTVEDDSKSTGGGGFMYGGGMED